MLSNLPASFRPVIAAGAEEAGKQLVATGIILAVYVAAIGTFAGAVAIRNKLSARKAAKADAARRAAEQGPAKGPVIDGTAEDITAGQTAPAAA